MTFTISFLSGEHNVKVNDRFVKLIDIVGSEARKRCRSVEGTMYKSTYCAKNREYERHFLFWSYKVRNTI